MEREDIGSEEGAKIDRLNQQCYLVDNYKSYAFPSQSYKNLTCLMGSPTDVMQKLSAKPGQEALLDMTPDKYAQLVPVIRLFKIQVDAETGLVKQGSKKQEIKFSTVYNEGETSGQFMWAGAAVYAASVTAGYRGDQVGLKEMSYELQECGGGNTLGKQQDITLKFVADSMQALERQGILDIIIRPKKETYEYDETGKIITERKDAKGNTYNVSAKTNMEYYALQLVFGWNEPYGSTLTVAERQALRKSTTTLTLNLGPHDLSFNDDGSVEITAEFTGYAEARMGTNQTNILYSTKEEQNRQKEQGKKVLEAERRVATFKKNEEKAQARVEQAKTDASARAEKKINAGGSISDGMAAHGNDKGENVKAARSLEGNKRAVVAEKVKLDEVKGAAEKILQKDRQARYSRVLTDLEKSGKLWHVDVPAEAIGRTAGSGKIVKITRAGQPKSTEEVAKMTPEEKKQYDLQRDQAAKRDIPKRKPSKSGPGSTVLGKAKEATKDHSEAKGDEATTIGGVTKFFKSVGSAFGIGKGSSDTIKGDYSKQNTAKAWSDGTKVRIYFLYWGDILGTILERGYKGKQLPIRYLVGTINFTDPRTGKATVLNLADIPISLNLFTTWWFNKVISPQRDVYTIKNFVRDSINELILAALGSDCYIGAENFGEVGGSAGKNSLAPPRIEFTTISVPLGQGQKERIPKVGRIGMNNDEIIAYVNNKKSGTDWSVPGNHVEYVYIYCNAWTVKKRSGNLAEDRRDGLYHLAIGQDAGPVKKISFERNEEMSEFKRTDAQMNQQSIDQLAAHYDASVEMMGNTIWLPSNYVYINPSGMGVTTRFAQDMGLGGYYTVVGLSGKISSTGWTTTMKCSHLFKSHAEREGFKAGGPLPVKTAGDKTSSNPEVKKK